MSVCRKLPDGTIQKIAGHTILLDANASEIREGTWSMPTSSSTSFLTCNVTFTDPMPDDDYVVVIEADDITSYQQLTQLMVRNKTTTGFEMRVVVADATFGIMTGRYTAFKPIKLDGYTELQNKVNNPDEEPTENSENLVKSGGVWEAIKNASAVWKGTQAEWNALPVAEKQTYDLAVLTDAGYILAVDRTDGSSVETANLNKIWRGTQAEWDALTDAEKDEWEEAQIIDDQYTAVPGTLIVAHDKVVATGDWMPDTTYEGYNYKAEITVAGVTSDYSPDVRFSFADANSGKIAGIADCAADKVIIYANAVPDADITIPVIICTLMEV